MECVEGCEFLRFEKKYFVCKYYEQILDTERNLETSPITIHVKRCKKCIEDNVIGENEEEYKMGKIRKHLGWLGDNFYSFKDEFESSLTEMYRIIKKVEKNGKK